MLTPREGMPDMKESTMEEADNMKMADLIEVGDIMVVGDIIEVGDTMEDTKDQEDMLTGMMKKVRANAQDLKGKGWIAE